MHLQSCLQPKLIVNPRTGMQQYVPCGVCAACIRARSMRWCQRLEQERFSWKYAVFFTLTYAPEYLPHLKRLDNHLVDILHVCTPPSEPVISFDIDECLNKHSSDFKRDRNWLLRIGLDIPVLSHYHLQKFLKRLRTYAKRDYDKALKQGNLKENFKLSFRYFCIGEYGSVFLRPHYHGILYFNSEYFASHVGELVARCWKFGRIDTSFVSGDNGAYVAKYLNSLSNIPSVYKHRQTRPFFLCSKFPPLGTLCTKSSQVQKMFFDLSLDFVIFDHRKSAFDNVPLWRTYIDRLFPRLSQFDSFSHSDRVTLYGFVERKNISSFAIFRNYVSCDVIESRSPLVRDYYEFLSHSCENLNVALQRWFYISSRVSRQAESFGISLRDYVSQIERFYKKVDYAKLKQQYDYQMEKSDKGELRDCIAFDSLWIRSFIDIDVCDVSYEDLLVLQSYGIDIDKFFSEDYDVRTQYQHELLPESTFEFDCYRMDSENWLSRSVKTKKKNDYILNHESENILF